MLSFKTINIKVQLYIRGKKKNVFYSNPPIKQRFRDRGHENE